MAGGSGWDSSRGIHARLEVDPALAGDGNVRFGRRAGVLLEGVQQRVQPARLPIEDAVERPPVVAAHLPHSSPSTCELCGKGRCGIAGVSMFRRSMHRSNAAR